MAKAKRPPSPPPPEGPPLPAPKRARNWRGGVKPGRKPTREGSWVEHRARPKHDVHNPAFVSIRARPDTDLTVKRITEAIIAGLKLAANANWERQKARRRTFRVIHFAIRPDRLELLVESTSADALARGMQGLGSGLARRVNHKLRRKGGLFVDRYDARDIDKLSDLRKVIAYMQGDGPDLGIVTPPRTKLMQAAHEFRTTPF
jgi:hypothetical protein